MYPPPGNQQYVVQQQLQPMPSPAPQPGQPQPQYIQQQPQPGQPQPQYIQQQPQPGQQQPMSATTVTQQPMTTVTHGLAIPALKNSVEYKNRKKNENALVWYLAKIDKYQKHMLNQASKSSIEFCVGDQTARPSKSTFGRTDVCVMETFTCCCFTSCYAPFIRIYMYDENCCQSCCLGCFFSPCLNPGLLHDFYDRLGFKTC
jgi:hypothetical protein